MATDANSSKFASKNVASGFKLLKIINCKDRSAASLHSWKRNSFWQAFLSGHTLWRIFHLSKLPPNTIGECWISRAYIIDRSLFHVSSSARDIPVCSRRPCAHTIRGAITSLALGDISTLIIVIRVFNWSSFFSMEKKIRKKTFLLANPSKYNPNW